VLARDGYQCRVCAAAHDIIVHHCFAPAATPGSTGCARSIRWVPELLLLLWAEQHPGPLQLQFQMAA
jgi:hypothetical protein